MLTTLLCSKNLLSLFLMVLSTTSAPAQVPDVWRALPIVDGAVEVSTQEWPRKTYHKRVVGRYARRNLLKCTGGRTT